MTTSEVLFTLLRYALGTARPEDGEVLEKLSLEEWNEVFDFAGKQNVIAIAHDGLDAAAANGVAVGRAVKEADEENGCEVWSDFVSDWGANVYALEQKYAHRWQVACKVADIWHENGLKTFVLKGIAFAQAFPIPHHRYSCDIDLLPVLAVPADDGIRAWDLSNQLLSEKGAKVNTREKKHSHIDYKGEHIENHQFVCGVKGDKRGRALDTYMKHLLESADYICIDGSNLLAPTALFNLLLCIKHAQTHFLVEEGITLRHLLDWALLRNGESGMGKEEFNALLDRFGLLKMKESMDEVADFALMGNEELGMRNEMKLSRRASILLDDILAEKEHLKSGGSRFKAHVNILRTIWCRRKLYKDFSDISALKRIWIYLKGYFGGI